MGAGAYALANHGKAFDWKELAVAAGAGALAGGLIGSGAVLAAAGSAAVAGSLMGAGSSIAMTGATYIADHPSTFDSRKFVIQTGIAGAQGAITGNPEATLAVKAGANMIGGLYSYELTDDNPTPVGRGGVILTSLLATGVNEGMDNWSRSKLMIDTPDINIGSQPPPSGFYQTMSSQALRTVISSTVNGAVSGYANRLAHQLVNRIQQQLSTAY